MKPQGKRVEIKTTELNQKSFLAGQVRDKDKGEEEKKSVNIEQFITCMKEEEES